MMRYLGTVQEVTSEGRLVVRGAFLPEPRSLVLDNRGKRLGRVRRVFGPVDSPYVSVDPIGDTSLLRLIGRQTYIEGVDKDGKGKRRNRRG